MPKKKASKRPAKAAGKTAGARPKKATQPRSPARSKPAPRAKAAKPAPPAPAPSTVAPAPALAWRQPMAGETFLGVVDDFYGHVSVIAFKLRAPLKVGDTIHVRGHTTDMTERVESMQIEHVPVTEARAGDAIGIKAVGKCRSGDYVYRLD